MNPILYVLAKGLHRSTLEIAIDLIYAASGVEFPIDKVVFGKPREIDVRPDLPTDPNTFVGVKVAREFDYRYNPPGTDGFMYTRIPLTLITPRVTVSFVQPTTFPFTTHSILNQINAKLNTKLLPEDVENDKYLAPSGSIVVRAASTSLVWLGEISIAYGEALFSGRITEGGSIRITESGKVRTMEKDLVEEDAAA